MRMLAFLIVLASFFSSMAKTYCEDNSTLVVESNKTVNGINYIEKKRYNCNCVQDKCLYNMDVIVFSIIAFVSIFSLFHKNILISTIGGLALIVLSVFVISGIYVTVGGVPISTIKSEFLGLFIASVCIIKISYNMVKING